ncbi:hypothetical protein [Streptomyces gilvosporeus]|uniref:Uncharacterized protein n=1 Tax=Streptomyces gilvosporeus TaxID=553510 RepID=A0A1V0U083_9ACTN|nr:hypothetical protein [Streptomyces gilvosporeus]ARF58629.1 hypothetical protein B1H19_34520 [Streptomyces gilvosporeus]
MSHPPVVVHPPSPDGGRQVTIGGEPVGRAYSTVDVLEFLRRAGLATDVVTLDDREVIEWRGGDHEVWS